MVACESIELYDSVGGDFQTAIKAGIPIERRKLIIDSSPPLSNLNHVDKREGDYLCVRSASSGSPRWPHCYWLDGRKFQNIGHVPQLSDEQFSEVERLLAESDRLRKVAKGYSARADDLIYDGDARRHLDSS